MNTYREASKKDWRTRGGTATDPEIDTGSLQRIADACELMASDHGRLLSDVGYWKRTSQHSSAEAERLYRSNAALRGHITRLKRKLEKAGDKKEGT